MNADKILTILLVVASIAAIFYGLWLMFEPVAYVATGAIVLSLCVFSLRR